MQTKSNFKSLHFEKKALKIKCKNPSVVFATWKDRRDSDPHQFE